MIRPIQEDGQRWKQHFEELLKGQCQQTHKSNSQQRKIPRSSPIRIEIRDAIEKVRNGKDPRYWCQQKHWLYSIKTVSTFYEDMGKWARSHRMERRISYWTTKEQPLDLNYRELPWSVSPVRFWRMKNLVDARLRFWEYRSDPCMMFSLRKPGCSQNLPWVLTQHCALTL